MLKILCGGVGTERLVSVASAQNVAKQWPDAEVSFWNAQGIHLLDHGELARHRDPFTRALSPRAAARHPSVAAWADDLSPDEVLFLCLHGVDGESGELQSLLDARGLAYTGSGALASRLAYDKPSAKQVAKEQGIATAQGRSSVASELAEQRAWVEETLRLGHALFAKPSADGSSVGLCKITSLETFDQLVRKLAHDTTRSYLVEQAVVGRELTVGVVEWEDGLAALPCSEVVVQGPLTFGYEEKYVSAGAQEITPAQLPPELALRAQDLALRMHRALGCRGYSRTDCIWAGDELVFLELNTLPGLTERSFITQQLAVAGRSLRSFLERQVALARARKHEERQAC